MTVKTYSLEHFYYGQLLYQGKAQGDLQLLASSSGITQPLVAEALQVARIPPLPDHPTGAWALVRGRSVPFFFAQSQIGARGQAMIHIVVLPVDTLREIGGSLETLARLLETAMPVYERVGVTLPTLTLTHERLPDAEEQKLAIESLLEAASYKVDTLERLLAALVQGTPIIVQGAPANERTRREVIAGMLALLPQPTRFGVTFATHSLPSTRIDAQVRFMNDAASVANAVIYTWGALEVTGEVVVEDYSRFIKSQLRLDIGLVVEQTEALTQVASWRIRRGDNLGQALKYAANRIKIDLAIRSYLPVDASEAAKVLSEDPTLSDALKAAYVRHLLAFALVLEEFEQADLLAVVVRGQPELERIILSQMNEALTQGKAERVYRAVARWLANPMGFNGAYWVDLTQRSAIAYAELLANARKSEALNAFLRHILRNHGSVETMPIIPRLIEIALPLAVNSRDLATTTFILAGYALPVERWQPFLAIKALPQQLPTPAGRLMTLLQDTKQPPAPGLLVQAAASFGESARVTMAIRLAEVALMRGRADLVDHRALSVLVNCARGIGESDKANIAGLRSIVRTLSQDDMLAKLDLDAARSLLQVLLVLGVYDELASEVLHQGRLLYPLEKQLHYGAMMRSLFRDTPMVIERAPAALHALNRRGVKPFPLAMAYFGALEQHQWSYQLDEIASELTTLIFGNRLIMDALQFEQLMALLRYHNRRRDAAYVERIALLLPGAAVRKGEASFPILSETIKALNWDKDMQGVGLMTLRRLIRQAPPGMAVRAIAYFGDQLGTPVREALQATIALNRLTGGESFADYAYSLRVVGQFLYDTGLTYADKSNLPTVPGLYSDLDGLNGGLSDAERTILMRSIWNVGIAVSEISRRHRRAQQRERDGRIEDLIAGKGKIETLIDLFRVMGGYFARGRRLSARMERAMTLHPLGDRSAPNLLRELQQVERLLRTALSAFDTDEPIDLSAQAVRAELESLWSEIALYERRALVHDLAIDLQRIPELVLMITEKGDARALQNNVALVKRLDATRQKPETTLEFYRFVHGYFRNRIRRKDST